MTDKEQRDLVGSGLIDNSIVSRWIMPPLTDPKLILVWAAMRRVKNNGHYVDLLTVRDEMAKTNALAMVGGSAFISGLVDGIPDIGWAWELMRALDPSLENEKRPPLER